MKRFLSKSPKPESLADSILSIFSEPKPIPSIRERIKPLEIKPVEMGDPNDLSSRVDEMMIKSHNYALNKATKDLF